MKDKNLKETPPLPLKEKEVRDYLVRHPDFFEKNPDLLIDLLPSSPDLGEGVEDFRAFLLERLQGEVRSLKDFHGNLINTSRSNQSTQVQVHEAVLALLEAESLDHLCHIVTQDWVQNLHVDVISICFEPFPNSPFLRKNSIRALKKDSVDHLMGQGGASLLRNDGTAREEIFGPATALIKAEALIRIEASAVNPVGIIAFGSREQDFFTPGQGTEMLRFLEAAFRGSLIQWLKP